MNATNAILILIEDYRVENFEILSHLVVCVCTVSEMFTIIQNYDKIFVFILYMKLLRATKQLLSLTEFCFLQSRFNVTQKCTKISLLLNVFS